MKFPNRLLAVILCIALLFGLSMVVTGCKKEEAPSDPSLLQESPEKTPQEDTASLPEESVSTEPPSVQEPEPEPAAPTFHEGIYIDPATPDTLTIHKIDDSTMEFSVFWYRTNGIDYAVAELSENGAVFSYTLPEGTYAEGSLEILDDQHIALNLTDTNLLYIEPGRTEYEFFGTESEYSDAYHAGVLLMNNLSLVWHAQVNYDEIQGYTDLYLLFYEDGTYMGLRLVPFGGESVIESFEGSYRVEDGILYLGDNAYDLYAESTGITQMQLQGETLYEPDFSGLFLLEESDIYEFMLSEP